MYLVNEGNRCREGKGYLNEGRLGFGANQENSRCFGTRKLGLMMSVWDLGHGEEILMGFGGGCME